MAEAPAVTFQLEEARAAGSGPILPKVARALNNLGFVERDQKRMEEARKRYEEALKIRLQLAQQDPAAYVPYLAMTLNVGPLPEAGTS